jgi:hypothetical protein
VLANDVDADGDALMPFVSILPLRGTVSLYRDGSFVYTPEVGFNGIDSFSYRVNDVTSQSELATVFITVSNNPLRTLSLSLSAATVREGTVTRATLSLSRPASTVLEVRLSSTSPAAAIVPPQVLCRSEPRAPAFPSSPRVMLLRPACSPRHHRDTQ